MSTYTLNVFFDNKQLTSLYQAGYNVCISKLVNGKYTVVWSGQTVSASNVFQWTENYQVFATSTFQSGLQVSATTTAVDIAYGQTATVGPDGVMNPAVGPHVGASFTAVNKWMPTHFGVNQQLAGVWQPVFVDPLKTLVGSETFTPVVGLIVFLSRTYKTGSMFTDAQSVVYPVTYSGSTTQSVSYVTDPSSPGGLSGMWINGSPSGNSAFSAASVDGKELLAKSVSSGQLAAQIPQTYSHERGFELLPHAYDAFKMAELINFFVNDFELAPESGESKESKGTKESSEESKGAKKK